MFDRKFIVWTRQRLGISRSLLFKVIVRLREALKSVLMGLAGLQLGLAAGVAGATDAQWDSANATGNWTDAGSWIIPGNPGVAPNNGAGGLNFDVVIDNDAGFDVVVALNTSPTIDSLTVDAGDRLSFNNGSDLVITNNSAVGLVVDGVIALSGVGAITDLALQNSTTLSGSGVVELGNGASNTANRVTTDGSVFTLSNGTTIRGAGTVLANSGGLINNGIVRATESTAALVIDPGAGSSVTNNSTLEAANGGTLRLNGGLYLNTGGVIQALDNSTVELGTDAEISGGTLSSAGTGRIDIANGADPILTGNITNNAAVSQRSVGAVTTAQINTSASLGGNGTWQMEDLGGASDSGNIISAQGASAVLTNELGHTIAGVGRLGNNTLQIINEGVVDANRDASVNGNFLGINPNASGFLNDGTLQATNGGVLRLEDGLFTNDGVIRAAEGSTVRLAGNAELTGSGELQSVGTGRISMENGDDIILSGNVTNNAQVSQRSAGAVTALQIRDNVTLNGTGVVQMEDVNGLSDANIIRGLGGGDDVLTNAAGHAIAGVGQIGQNTLGIINDGLIDANRSVATNGNQLAIDVDGNGLTNNGTLRASNGGLLNLSTGTVNNAAGTILALADSVVQLSSGVRINGGTLQTAGTGRIRSGGAATLDGIGMVIDGVIELPKWQRPHLGW